MQRLFLLLCVWVALLPVAGAQSTPVTTGGPVHGTVKAGNVPLPGVSIVATSETTLIPSRSSAVATRSTSKPSWITAVVP